MMALSKRLQDSIKNYMTTLADCRAKGQAVIDAQEAYRKAKSDLSKKATEVLFELGASPYPAGDKTAIEITRVVEMGGKTYVISDNPKDISSDMPSYIREVQVER